VFSFSQKRELAAGQFTYYGPTLRSRWVISDFRSQINNHNDQATLNPET